MRIAIYGKGGIGKSTISANLAAALARMGQRVLQIGCDPKHDSTRLLLGGQRITVALEYLGTVAPERQRLEDIVHTGYGGVQCVEAGGPEPGVGCAGRGILSTFALLERLGLDLNRFDVVVYDVLGDVVCGGFAVPLRRGYADRLYIVTSEEFMAIYAANNILRGAHNFDGIRDQVAGLILNSRGSAEDPAYVQRFATAVELPITLTIARSELFRRAEEQGQTVVEAFPDSAIAGRFAALARNVLAGMSVHTARPLTEHDLEQVVFQRQPPPDIQRETPARAPAAPADLPPVAPAVVTAPPALPPRTPVSVPAQHAETRFLSKSMLAREPLHGCAFAGAVSTTTQIAGTVTLAHGPRSCTHIVSQTILSSGMRTLAQAGIGIPAQLTPALISTGMNERDVIHGGGERLVAALRQACATNPDAIFLVTTCPAGIIGEDVTRAITQVAHNAPTPPILPISSDGNLGGDYMQGVINACIEGAAALIDPDVSPCDDWVNIVAEKNIATNAEANMTWIAHMLTFLGLRVNCRFVRRTSVAELRQFCAAPLSLLAYDDHLGRVLRAFLVERFGCSFARHPFPVGFFETAQWLRDIGQFFQRGERAEALIAQAQVAYNRNIERLRPVLAGKRLMLATYNHSIDWLLEIALDLEMDIVKVGLFNSCQDASCETRYAGRVSVETSYAPEQRSADIARLQPDLLLSNYMPTAALTQTRVAPIPLCPDIGFEGALRLAEHWATRMQAPATPGWRHDAPLVSYD